MALDRHSGAFAANTGSATTSVTAPGFQPSVVIIFGSNQTTDETLEFTTNSGLSYGFSNGTTHGYTAWAADDNVATTNIGTAYSETRVVGILTNGTPTVTNEATLAMTANGFDLTFNSTPAAAYRMGYIAIGGTDVTNVAIGFVAMPTTVTTLDVNVGFVGDFGIFFSGSRTAAGTGTHAHMSVGFAASATKEVATNLMAQDGQTMTGNVNAMSWVRNDATLIGQTTGNAADYVADFVSFNQGGTNNTFRLNFSDAPPSAYKLAYCIIKGPQFDCGVSTAPATATTQTVTGMAFQPTLGGWHGMQVAALNTITANACISFGGAISTATEVALGQMIFDATINTSVQQQAWSSKCALKPDAGIKADFTSFNADGWTITWAESPSSTLIPWWAAAGAGAAPVGHPTMRRWGGIPGMDNYTGRGNW